MGHCVAAVHNDNNEGWNALVGSGTARCTFPECMPWELLAARLKSVRYKPFCCNPACDNIVGVLLSKYINVHSTSG